MQRALEISGHVVETSENGEDALYKMLHESFDAVVMDLQMPVMGGLEACRRLREHESKLEEDKGEGKSGASRLAVVGVSASVDGDVRMEALEAGMDFLLARPHSIQKLLDAIASVLGMNPSRRGVVAAMEVLVVDDSVPVLKTTKRALEVTGFTVQVAANGADALALLKTRAFDAVVLDVRMPGMSGLDVSRQLRLHERHAGRPPNYLIGVSYMSDDDAPSEALAAGMDAFVVKSGTFGELVRAIRTVSTAVAEGKDSRK